jgi:hypothetical protein
MALKCVMMAVAAAILMMCPLLAGSATAYGATSPETYIYEVELHMEAGTVELDASGTYDIQGYGNVIGISVYGDFYPAVYVWPNIGTAYAMFFAVGNGSEQTSLAKSGSWTTHTHTVDNATVYSATGWCNTTYAYDVSVNKTYDLSITWASQGRDAITREYHLYNGAPRSSDDGSAYILLQQSMGMFGLALFATGTLFAIYASRREGPAFGISVGLIVMLIGGVFTYVFILEGG